MAGISDRVKVRVVSGAVQHCVRIEVDGRLWCMVDTWIDETTREPVMLAWGKVDNVHPKTQGRLLYLQAREDR